MSFLHTQNSPHRRVFYSRVVELVQHRAVNADIAGSSPALGALYIFMKKIVLFIGSLLLAGGGCANAPQQVVSSSSTIPLAQVTSSSLTEEQLTAIYDQRIANAARYMKDKNFVAFIRSVQPSGCKGKTPTVSYIAEADLTGDGQKELIVDATSCHTPSSGSDMNLVARMDKNGKYTALKIDGQTLVAYYSGLEVENSILVKESAVFNPGDAGCCPSGGVDLTYFKWNGSEFVTERTAHASDWLSPQE